LRHRFFGKPPLSRRIESMIQVDRQHGDIEILRSKAAFDPAASKRRGAGTQQQASSAPTTGRSQSPIPSRWNFATHPPTIHSPLYSTLEQPFLGGKPSKHQNKKANETEHDQKHRIFV
jgi:hypothetical protein